ncbi:MAG: type II secretion system protein [Clostridia bacterium]|nr:type II secretion system protein [Clostridia bacterium]
MRKILNKKGFSLSELVVVVALMGIILLVAVPSYRASQTDAENKSCGTNIEVIKTAVIDYYTSYQDRPDSVDDLIPFLPDDGIPTCPKSNNKTVYNYGIAISKNANNTWTGVVVCPCDDEKHVPKSEDASFSTAEITGQYYVLQNASTVTK